MRVLTLAAAVVIAEGIFFTIQALADREPRIQFYEEGVYLYDKGVYLGKPDTPVSDDARRGMRARLFQLNTLSGLGRGGDGSRLGAAPVVRPPAGADCCWVALPLDLVRRGAQRRSHIRISGEGS